jgi:hypothetical protein
MQAETPLAWEDIAFLREGPSDTQDLAWAIIERRQPRWLIGWRRNARSTDERTYIATTIPRFGAGDSVFLWHSNVANSQLMAGFLASISSLVVDFAARQKVGGTNLSFYFVEQFPILAPSALAVADLQFITPRALELTYTSHAMRPWAEDLGHHGPPFAWDEDRRALLRAELDAFFARKYGLTRDELVYVLDPAKAKGPDHPSETFRVLQKNEIARFGEYRTERLVLAAFDRLTGA